MTAKERLRKVEWLKNIQHYSPDFYLKKSDNQILAMYYAEMKNFTSDVDRTDDGKYQLAFDFDNHIVYKPKSK